MRMLPPLDLEEAALEVLIRARRSEWADFDPYDGLSGFASALPAKTVLAKRVVTQAVMRTSPHLRWLLGVRPHQEAYTTGLLISTAALLGDRAIDEFAGDLLEVLVKLRVGGTGAWGYSFPVVTRAAQYGPDTSNLISTAFAGLGLLDLIEATGDWADASELVIDATNWVVTSLWDNTLEGFRYHQGNQEFIYNASILGALLVARCSHLLGVGDPRLAERAVRRVMDAQREDGSWRYGESSRLAWVDNHHTSFILKALFLLPEAARPQGWQPVVDRGITFFLDRLTCEDGGPRASPERRYPLDSLAAGQAVEMLAIAAAVLDNESFIQRSEATLRWTQANLRRTDGRYQFRRGRYFNWPGAYLRWGEAHIALGAARLKDLVL